MFERTVSPDDLDRLARLRADAERDYNDALTRLDRALPGALDPPPPTPAHPDAGALREAAEAAGGARWAPPAPGAAPWWGWLHRILEPLVAPAFARQERFDRALLAHLTAQAEADAARRRRDAETLARIGTHLAETRTFESRLLQYLQRITAFVDTRDREVAGLMRRINEDNGAAIASLTAGLEALAGRQSDVRESVQVLHGAARTAARELHHLRGRFTALDARANAAAPTEAGRGASEPHAGAETASAGSAADAAPTPPESTSTPVERTPPTPDASDAPGAATPASSVSSASPAPDAPAGADVYAVFEDAFRGSPAAIADRQRGYLACFEGAADVLDLGCGRGEFLALARDAGITARGVDANREMVERCRDEGLDAVRGDALAHVAGLREASLGGAFAAQVVEHLDADYLLRLLAALHRALRPSARIVLETINPACWSAFFSAYLRDITHRHPLHPDTLAYLLRAHGFVDVEIVYAAPVPDAGRLQRVAAAVADDTPDGAALRRVIAVVNGNADHLNGLLFAHQDYAAVGVRA